MLDHADAVTLIYCSIAASTLTLIAFYYVFSVSKKPQLRTGNKKFKLFLTKYLPILNEKFSPCWFGWEGRLQTILGPVLRPSETEKIVYQRDIVNFQDGGQLALDSLEPSQTQKRVGTELVVFVLPGLTGGSKTSYVQSIVRAVNKVGVTVCVLNQRGLGNVPLKTPRTYCACKDEDVMEVIAHIRRKYPDKKMVAIGCSLGGMQFLHYLATYPKEAKENFIAALVLSVAWSPLGAMESLEKPFFNKHVLNAALTHNLQDLVIKHRSVLEKSKTKFDFDKILSCKTMREFDTCFIAPQFGYANVGEYYQDATNSVQDYSIPVLALNSTDDPIQPGKWLPIKKAEKEESNLALLILNHGGHLGFLDGLLPRRKPFHYMERLVMDWVNAVQLHPDEITKLS